jgi:hypothetical protein
MLLDKNKIFNKKDKKIKEAFATRQILGRKEPQNQQIAFFI